jgi:hypothetical protein
MNCAEEGTFKNVQNCQSCNMQHATELAQGWSLLYELLWEAQ